MKWEFKNGAIPEYQAMRLKEIMNSLSCAVCLDTDSFTATDGQISSIYDVRKPVKDTIQDLEDLANFFGYTLVPMKRTQSIEERAVYSPFNKVIVTDGDSM